MKLKLYSIIILICLVLLTILFLINKEGFKSDYSDYNKIDRIKNSSNRYAYCIGGNITCPDGSLNNLNDNYNGTTYDYLCKTNGQPVQAECTSFAYNMKSSDLLNWKTYTSREISFPFSQNYKGFTTDYTYIPVDINGDYINYYDSCGNIIDNMHKCDMLLTQSQTDDCKYQLKKAKDDASQALTNAADAAKAAALESSPKCIANYGTNVGDPLCCGQKGVLQYSAVNYVCPSTKPTCSNYECGKSFGSCS
jgi:hypothetical protein